MYTTLKVHGEVICMDKIADPQINTAEMLNTLLSMVTLFGS